MWIIDKDLLFIGDGSDVVPSRAGKIRSKNFDENYFLQQELVKFRLFDDDGELYYEGRMTKKRLDSEHAFAPLDWAMNDSGCTYLEYFEDNQWKML